VLPCLVQPPHRRWMARRGDEPELAASRRRFSPTASGRSPTCARLAGTWAVNTAVRSPDPRRS
jgi:hypothetical protein